MMRAASQPKRLGCRNQYALGCACILDISKCACPAMLGERQQLLLLL